MLSAMKLNWTRVNISYLFYICEAAGLSHVINMVTIGKRHS